MLFFRIYVIIYLVVSKLGGKFIKIIDNLKSFINKNEKSNSMLLNSQGNVYNDLINSPKIDSIINNMLKNLSQVEQTYTKKYSPPEVQAGISITPIFS